MEAPIVPHEPSTLDTTSSNCSVEVAGLCIRLLPEWQNTPVEAVKVQGIDGGITNELFKVSCGHGMCALVRVYGTNTDVLIDRAAELAALKQLNALGFGAKVLATFENGRIEEFLEARTLTPDDLSHPTMVPKIAQRLAHFHTCLIQSDDASPVLWRVIQSWLSMAKTLTFDDPAKAAKYLRVDFGMMEREAAAVQALCDSTHSPVVYSHNDLLAGNILALGAPRDEDLANLSHVQLQFIDFEYGGYGFRGFDWGNHFNEWAGFECDWQKCPSLEQQETFLQAYLQGSSVRSVSPQQIGMAIAEANAFSLASHVYWGIWALIQARYSPIDFDYIEYSFMRWREYHRRKAAVQELVLKQFPPPMGEPPRQPFPPAFPDAAVEEIPVQPPTSTAPVVDGEVVPVAGTLPMRMGSGRI